MLLFACDIDLQSKNMIVISVKFFFILSNEISSSRTQRLKEMHKQLSRYIVMRKISPSFHFHSDPILTKRTYTREEWNLTKAAEFKKHGPRREAPE